MNVPYSKEELKDELVLLVNREDIFDEEKISKITEWMLSLIAKDKKELNERIALSNGISVETLLSSINYELLKEEYLQGELDRNIRLSVGKIIEEMKVSEKGAWALLLFSLGKLFN